MFVSYKGWYGFGFLAQIWSIPCSIALIRFVTPFYRILACQMNMLPEMLQLGQIHGKLDQIHGKLDQTHGNVQTHGKVLPWASHTMNQRNPQVRLGTQDWHQWRIDVKSSDVFGHVWTNSCFCQARDLILFMFPDVSHVLWCAHVFMSLV